MNTAERDLGAFIDLLSSVTVEGLSLESINSLPLSPPLPVNRVVSKGSPQTKRYRCWDMGRGVIDRVGCCGQKEASEEQPALPTFGKARVRDFSIGEGEQGK